MFVANILALEFLLNMVYTVFVITAWFDYGLKAHRNLQLVRR